MIRRFASLGFVGILALAAAVPATGQERDWEETARSDIESAFATYRDNHPGWDDPDNPGFRRQLEAARDAGMSKAAGAGSREDYAAALGAFGAMLSDGHARLGVTWPQGAAAPKPLWPGLVLAWRGQRAIVHHAAAGSGWTRGSVMVSCDGRPFAAFAHDRIGMMGGRPADAGHWWSRMPLVLAGAETDIPARECTATKTDGRAVAHALDWTPPPENIAALRRAAGECDPLPVGLTSPSEGIHWIALPSFAPDADGRAAYDRLFSDLAAARPGLASARAVVIDLRGNQGGSSTWS
jgi:hypothetical protein